MKKRTLKYKALLVIIILFIFFLVLYFSLNNRKSISINFLKDILYLPMKNVSNNKSDLVGSNISTENNEEFIELKRILNINNTMSEYEKVNAVVIQRNNAYWFNELTINKGKSDSIDMGMAVVVGEGLIGKVQSVTNNTSVIKLMTSSDTNNKVSVKIKNNDEYIYKVLESENNKLIISGIDNEIKLQKDSIITTSGLSDIFPSGIYIGKIGNIGSDKYGISQKVFVNSSVDFNNIRFVTVLIRKI